jgi:hypothetical protein
MSPPPASPEADVDSTAELPILDPPAAHATDEQHGSTDTWASLPQLRPENERRLEATLEAMSAELRSAQQLLHSKTDRLRDLERERDEAREAHSAAEQRAADTVAAAARHQAASNQHAVQVSELNKARLAAEQHAAGLAAELAHLRAGGQAGSPQLAELRAAAEQRAALLDAEFTRLQSAATQHAAQFGELTQARTAAEQRVAQLQAELTVARDELVQAGTRAQQLAQRLQQQDTAREAERARSLAREKTRSMREQTHAAHIANVTADLHAERARALAYFESLQSVTKRRAIFEELVTDLHQEVHVRESELSRLARAQGERQARVHEQDLELAQRAARIALLEQDVASFGTALAERDALLRDGRREVQGLQANAGHLQAQLEASGQRLQALSAVAEQHSTTESQRKSELSRLLSERVDLTTELEAARADATAAAAHARANEQALNQQQTRVAELERVLLGERKRAEELEKELANLRREMEDWGDALKSVHQERGTFQSALAAAEARAGEAERREAEHRVALEATQEAAPAQAERVRELEGDLAAAEEAVLRLESEARKSAARMEELEHASEQWRTALAEARQGVADTSAQPLLRDADLPGDAAEPSAAPPPDGATRLLIFSADGREIVHVLGRKTSIGRTPDNDLQIEARFISRHHAVILAGPAQTIIEDLNSTNGVQVNGRRITRQVLEDGDTVSIGRQQYRFAVRKKDEPR